jgi:hypothetical protein
MEHAIHVSAGHFIKAVGPTSSRKIRKRVKDADVNSDVDSGGPLGDSGDEGNGLDFDAGDTVGKALALVTQVCLSSLSLLV